MHDHEESRSVPASRRSGKVGVVFEPPGIRGRARPDPTGPGGLDSRGGLRLPERIEVMDLASPTVGNRDARNGQDQREPPVPPGAPHFSSPVATDLRTRSFAAVEGSSRS